MMIERVRPDPFDKHRTRRVLLASGLAGLWVVIVFGLETLAIEVWRPLALPMVIVGLLGLGIILWNITQ